MIITEKVLGNLGQSSNIWAEVDYVNIDWHETHKKIHKKVTDQGVEIGIRLDDSILLNGLKQDDILYEEDNKIIAVNILPCDVLKIEVEDTAMVPKVCYEVGNKHMPFFKGDKENEFITPYDQPLEVYLQKLGIKTVHKVEKLDFKKAISTSLGGHHH